MCLNVKSVLQKVDMIKIWAYTTDMDVNLLSKTWLKKVVANEKIAIDGYNVFWSDRVNKGRGLGIYVKSKYNSTVTLSMT